jgi:ABC-type nitrate/sulfonate/bicarbonate transport system substrate-binding protein
MPSVASETLHFGKAVPQAFSFALLDVGVQQKFFRDEGIDVESTGFGGGAKAIQAMIAGSIDIGLCSGPDMASVAKGATIKGVAAMAGPPLDTTITVGAKTPIHTVADLKGKRIGVSAKTSLVGWLINQVSRQQGWGNDGIAEVEAGGPDTSWAMVKTGDLDGLGVDLGSALAAQSRGDARVVVTFGDVVKDFHNYVIFATDKLIAERPDAVRSFLRAWFRSVDFANSNKTTTIRIIGDLLKMDPAIVSQVYDIQMPMYSHDGRFNPNALATLARSYVETGNLASEPDMSKLYTEAFLPVPPSASH